MTLQPFRTLTNPYLTHLSNCNSPVFADISLLLHFVVWQSTIQVLLLHNSSVFSYSPQSGSNKTLFYSYFGLFIISVDKTKIVKMLIKRDKFDSSYLRTSFHQKIPLREWKGKAQSGKRKLQNIYLTYQKSIWNFNKTKKETTQYKNGQITWTSTHKRGYPNSQ